MNTLSCPIPGCYGALEPHAYEATVTDAATNHSLECALCSLKLGPYPNPEAALVVCRVLQNMKSVHAILSRFRTNARLVLAKERAGEARALVEEFLKLANNVMSEGGANVPTVEL